MIEFPSIDILIPTYARVSWLEEAIESALRQDYPGDVRIIVLNDCQSQCLEFDHEKVRVHNAQSMFGTLGEKMNALIALAQSDWIAFLDDDDILMPWHLRRIENALALGKRTAAATNKIWMVGKEASIEGHSYIDILVQRELALLSGGFSQQDNKQEHAFYANIEKYEPILYVNTRERPSYAYIWGNGAHHVSGTGALDAGIGFRRDAEERLAAGHEPRGRVTLRPRWHRMDYVEIARSLGVQV